MFVGLSCGGPRGCLLVYPEAAQAPRDLVGFNHGFCAGLGFVLRRPQPPRDPVGFNHGFAPGLAGFSSASSRSWIVIWRCQGRLRWIQLPPAALACAPPARRRAWDPPNVPTRALAGPWPPTHCAERTHTAQKVGVPWIRQRIARSLLCTRVQGRRSKQSDVTIHVLTYVATASRPVGAPTHIGVAYAISRVVEDS